MSDRAISNIDDSIFTNRLNLGEVETYRSKLDSDIFVVGLPRSGNTYFLSNLTLAYPEKKILSHIHDFDFCRELKEDSNVLVIIRNPEELALSWAIMSYGNYNLPNARVPAGMDAEQFIIFQIETLAKWYRPTASEEFSRLNKIVIRFTDIVSDLNSINKKISSKFLNMGEPLNVEPDSVNNLIKQSIYPMVGSQYLKYGGWIPDSSRKANEIVEKAMLNQRVKEVIFELNSLYLNLDKLAD
jgi:hypothetical protein